jgi:hypothetical protein
LSEEASVIVGSDLRTSAQEHSLGASASMFAPVVPIRGLLHRHLRYAGVRKATEES